MFAHSFYKIIIYDRPGCNQANCSLSRVSLICTGVCVCIDQGVQHRLMPLIQNKNSCLHQNCSAKRFCQPFYSIYMKHLHTWPMAIHVHMHFHSSSPCKQKFFRWSFEIWSNELSRSSETPSIHFYKAPAEVSYSENSLTFRITINFVRRILVTPR